MNGVGAHATQSFTLTVNQAPAITSATSTTFTAGAAGSFALTATGYPAPTFTEGGALPGGVTLSSAGVLSGTPAAGTGGTYSFTNTASNGVGTDSTQAFTLTVNQALAITSSASATFTVGAASTFAVTATGYPQPSLSETGTLPGGVTFDAATGVLSGTPAAGTGGTYSLTLTASNGVSADATQSFTLTVDQAPAITSATSATFSVGAAGAFTVAATGYPAPTLSETGALPGGVTFNTATGALSGTPAAGTGGSYSFTLTATNGVGTGSTQSFTLTVNQPPAITSAASATLTAGTPGSFTVAATGYPAPTITETGALPSGVTLSSAGVLSGTPAAGTGGTYSITLTASNGVGTDSTQSFTLTVNQPPSITSTASATFTAGAAGSFTVASGGYPTPTFTETGALPSGVALSSAGVLSGTPAVGTGGAYPLTIKATNGVGTGATQSFTLTVDEAPAITSVSSATFTAGTPGSFSLTATGYPAPTLSETGALPGGVTFNAASGVLSGTPAAGTGGAYSISFKAANGIGSDATQTFTLAVDQAPAINSASSATFRVGTLGSFTVSATGYPTPTLGESGALPSGVGFSATTGVLSGTPAAGTGGTYSLTLTASNGVGTGATQSFTLSVEQPPAITSASTTAFTVGTAGSFTVAATGYPAPTFTETGTLPAGVTLSSAGILSGTPAAGTGGTYSFTITAANGVGTNATQNFTLTVDQAPAMTSASSTAFTVGTAGTFTAVATGYQAPTFSETGALPGGVTLNAATGVLSGTPAAGTAGTYSLSLKASNGVGTDATQNFTLTVNETTAITSASSTTFTVGTAGTFTVTATGYPQPTLGETGTLPGGVTFAAATGVLSGTPSANSAGTYSLTFTASNGVGANAQQSFTLTVQNPAPVLYSISPTAGTAGDSSTTLTVGGADFTGQAVVYWDATALATTYVSSTQLTATIPSSLLVNTGTFSITVMTPGPGGGASTSLTFTIWPSYPRSGAGSVLTSAPPALPTITQTGTVVSVLDWSAQNVDSYASPEDVLATDHLVSELGIPSTDVTSVPSPTTSPFLLVVGALNNSNLTNADVTALTNYVQGGGTLYLWQPNVSSLLTALGISTTYAEYIAGSAGSEQRPLSFDKTAADSSTFPLVKYINDPAEINWAPFFPVDDVTRGYDPGSCTSLATWGQVSGVNVSTTGYSAVVRCDLSSGGTTGHAYVFGWRLRPLLSLAERQLGNDTGPQSTNEIVPDADICRMLMRGSYEGFAANPQERQWAPGGDHAALIITHDVDATVSYQNMPAWVDFEDSLGIKSTYFFTTSPYDNGWVGAMYSGTGLDDVQYALSHGFDVEDHSFGHFPDFPSAPYSLTSPPSETASNYQPMYSSSTGTTTGMSVIGELGVSKWLLENDFNTPITSFRAGYLDIPLAPSGTYPRILMLEGLSATGYQRDSTYALALTRGSFPFALFDEDGSTGTVTPYHLMEYPLDISGDHPNPVLSSTSLSTYLSQWETVIKFNYDNNAPTILLLHPIDTQIRFQAEQALINYVRANYPDMWIGDLNTFAQFWESQGVTNANGW